MFAPGRRARPRSRCGRRRPRRAVVHDRDTELFGGERRTDGTVFAVLTRATDNGKCGISAVSGDLLCHPLDTVHRLNAVGGLLLKDRWAEFGVRPQRRPRERNHDHVVFGGLLGNGRSDRRAGVLGDHQDTIIGLLGQLFVVLDTDIRGVARVEDHRLDGPPLVPALLVEDLPIDFLRLHDLGNERGKGPERSPLMPTRITLFSTSTPKSEAISPLSEPASSVLEAPASALPSSSSPHAAANTLSASRSASSIFNRRTLNPPYRFVLARLHEASVPPSGARAPQQTGFGS